MDAIAGLLDGPRAAGAFLLRCVLEPPFSVCIEDGAPLTVVVVTRGATGICPSGRPGVTYPAAAGDVVVVRGPEPYTVTDDPTGPVQAVIGPDQSCWSPPGTARPPHELGVRSWGHAPDAATSMLVGTYPVGGEVGARLVRSLPQVTVLRPADLANAATGPLVELLDAELDRDAPGQDVVLDRALDLLLATVLRAWFAGPGAPSAARARQDPALGPALRAMEAEPGRGWTVAALARGAGLSRAAFARRFTERVGEAPMAWLTDLRLALAADLLRGTDLTLATIADRVGYGSPFALSAAFLRERGVRPTALRAM